jgi:hypothetical protein
MKEKIEKYGIEIIIALILLIIIIVIYNARENKKISNDILEGLWNGDENFCNKSQIDGMMVYIGPIISNGWDPRCQERKAYLIMYANNSIIANKKFNIVLQESFLDKINPFIKSNLYKTIYLYDESPEEQLEAEVDDISLIHLSKIMPLIQNMELNLITGKMTWSDPNDETVYAELYKDNLSSKYGKLGEINT